jgi:hypothetical protein
LQTVGETWQAAQAHPRDGVAAAASPIQPRQRSGRGGPARHEPRGAVESPAIQDPEHPLPSGLVPSAKTGRVAPLTLAGLDISNGGPGAVEVGRAAAAFGPSPWRNLAEDSPLPRLYITPGSVLATRKSSRQLVRQSELAQIRRDGWVNAAALYLKDNPDWRPKAGPGQEITEWSAKSRVNMVRTFAMLDWRPVYELGKTGRVPAMVTLTYPGVWEVVAPDGKALKAQVAKLKRRYRRAWGESLVGAWKLEFQKRGAPHVHVFMVPPHGVARGRGVGAGLAFRHWLSVVWADVVDHPDPVEYQKHLEAGTGVDYEKSLRCTDAKRLAVYFGKHGQYRDKEYQHVVPEAWRAAGKGPGRFWGYWGLRVLAVAAELTGENYQLAARILRRYASRVRVWDDSAGRWKYTRLMSPAKPLRKDVDEVTGEVVWRRRRRRVRVRRFASGSGFLLVNDGPAIARQLARALAVCGVPP